MRYAILLSLIIFLVCLVYSFYFQIKPEVDAAAYDIIAMNIAKGRGFVEFPNRPFGMDRDIVHIGQSYTVFLALIYKIFGHHYSVVWFFQALLHALTCLFIYFICLNIFDERNSSKIGLLAMGIYGFWPDLVESTAMLMTEIFFLFFTVWLIYLFVKFFKNADILKAILIGLIISIAALTRPTILFFGIVFVILVIFKKDFQKKYIYLIPIILIPVIFIGSWMYRNYLKYDRFVISTTGGYDLWIGNNPKANGEMEPSQEIVNYFNQYGFVNIDKKGIGEVKKFALEQPFDFLKLQLIKTSKYFSLIRPSGWWRHLNKIETVSTLLLSAIFGAIGFIFGIGGILYSFKEKNFFFRLLFYLAICGLITVIPIVVGTRYRYQIYPFLAIFAAYFLINLFVKKEEKLYKIPLVVFIVLSLNSIYDLLTNFDVFLEHLNRII